MDDRKLVYGESFVMYALVEYYRASGDKQALRHALDLYDVLQQKAYDPVHTGWGEHFYRDWRPLPKFDPNAEVEVAGYKSANTHLHLMEALTELYEASRDPKVKKSLQEAVKINRTWFYPQNAGKSAFHRQPDWTEVTDPKSAGLSYGHNAEFAWLMIRAQKVLGEQPAWDHFTAHVEHTLNYGFDHARGGVYSRGNGISQPLRPIKSGGYSPKCWRRLPMASNTTRTQPCPQRSASCWISSAGINRTPRTVFGTTPWPQMARLKTRQRLTVGRPTITM